MIQSELKVLELKVLGRKIAEEILKRADLKIGFGFHLQKYLENEKIGKILDELMDQKNVSIEDRKLLALYAGGSTIDLLFEHNLHIGKE